MVAQRRSVHSSGDHRLSSESERGESNSPDQSKHERRVSVRANKMRFRVSTAAGGTTDANDTQVRCASWIVIGVFVYRWWWVGMRWW